MRLLITTIILLFTYVVHSQTPNAAFSATPLTVCLGSPVTFTNQSTSALPISSYNWDFGDGSSATNANTSHIYPTVGLYTVTLVVVNSSGVADAEVKTDYIRVVENPTATFTTSGNGCTVPFGVTFTNTSTTGTGINYSWNFGNGQTSTQQNPPMVNYTTAGTYNVTLTVTNSGGCVSTLTKSIVVSNYATEFQSQSSACVGEPVQFTDLSTVGANAWSWNFGTGTSTQQNPSVTYNAPGTYNVSLSSQNTISGCSGSAIHQITILPKPAPSFTATPSSGCAPLSVSFTNTSGAGIGFQWDFGNGNTFNGQNPPNQIYTNNGSYNVSMVMTGTNGCSATVTQNGIINLSNPVANFSANVLNGCDPLAVQFTDASISPNSTSNPIISWQWNFGNGNTFSGQNPPVQIFTVGVYDIRLIITTQSGCRDTTVLQQYIKVGKIDNMNFLVDPLVECAKTDIDFINTSLISAPHASNEVTYYWDFGDGNNSTDENPTHAYELDSGYFDVSLIIDFRGCKDTIEREQAVYIKAPIAKFITPISLFCNPASFPVNVAVTDQSIIGKNSDDALMIWRWGDGSNTSLDDPDLDDADHGNSSHNYTGYGSFTIKQVIYNTTTGCSDSVTNVIHISRIQSIFTVANDSVCKNSPLQLTSNSTSWSTQPTPHPITGWSYNMGNSAVVTSGSNPTYSYPQSGTYTITLTVTNSVGCSASSTFAPLTVLELPLGVITADDNAGCAPFLVHFSNGSSVQGNGVPLQSFVFSFSDNASTQSTTSVSTSVNHTFTSEGNFTASIVATDVFGCKSLPVSTPITITKPIASFSVPAVICDESSYLSNNTSTGVNPMTYEWFLDGTATSTNTNVTGSFNEVNNPAISSYTHTYVLIATDGNGCKDTISQQIMVSVPTAIMDTSFSGASTNANGEFTCPPVFGSFVDLSNSEGTITSWLWIFGDGKQSINQNSTNTYVFPGTYDLTLTITDEYGCSDDTTIQNYITIYGPTGEPDWSTLTGQCGQNIFFELNNPQNVESLVWHPGDGQNVNDSISFTHVFPSNQTFYPSISLIDDQGCEVIYYMDTIIIPDSGLDAYFVPSATELDLGQAFVFDDQSSSINSTILNWTWDFGNGITASSNAGNDQTQTYYLGGNKVVTLKVTDDNGCFSTYQVVILVDSDFEMPNVFTPNKDNSNDFFTLPKNIFSSYNVIIHNRWGNVVQSKNNATDVVLWNGTNNGGEMCAEGVYFFQLDGILVDGTPIQKKGFVHLLYTGK